MTGLFECTSGAGRIFGYDILTQQEEIRQHLGVCPQSDVLFPDLTTMEMLQFIAELKGKGQHEVEEIIREINLTNEKWKLTKELSGGNKRKLSVSMAFLAGHKVVILDEPTSGMDPISRQQVWEMLLRLKLGKTILLTTQFLDEADFLADKIAILNSGELQTFGSPMELKRRFGVGYSLKVTKATVNEEDLAVIVRENLPEAYVKRDREDLIEYILPFTGVEKYPVFFEKLETVAGIEFGLEMNSLEDVFFAIVLNDGLGSSSSPDIQEFSIPPNILSIEPTPSLRLQLKAMFSKKLHIFLRDPRQWLMTSLPLLFTFLACSLFIPVNEVGTGENDKFQVIVNSYMFAFFTLMGFSYCSSKRYSGSYIEAPVAERQSKLRHMLYVSGISGSAYWGGSVLLDFLLFIYPGIFFVVLVFAL